MVDIRNVLIGTMTDAECSPLRALFILSESEESLNELAILQPKSSRKVGRRLCDSGHNKNDR